MKIPVIQKLIDWYGVKTVLLVAVVFAVLLVAAYVTLSEDEVADEVAAVLPTVETATVASLAGTVSWTVLGEVEAISQAELRSETGGRVTNVSTKLGDSVRAGSVLAQLENASERAAVLQAEGSYEAAQAAANQSDLDTSQAENNLRTAENNLQAAYDAINNLNRSAYTSSNEIVLQDIDVFFKNPLILDAKLQINGRTRQNFLEAERESFREMLEAWRADTLAATPGTLETLAMIGTNINRVLAVVDTFIMLLPREEATASYTQAELDTALAKFNTIRSQLISVIASVEQNRTSLMNAEKSVANAESVFLQAQISGTNGDLSAANAQVKQALGSLRSAQANLAKTIIISPITGEVNNIEVNVGDFVAPQTVIAEVANNNALEITTFIGESDRATIEVGQTVIIEGVYEGIVTTIANAINQNTKKIEVKIATETEELANGDTVTITNVPTEGVVNAAIYIPITAVKFTDTAGTVFMVADGKLSPVTVQIGSISGSNVEIISGLSTADEIVVDARGRVTGQEVEAITK